jgi:hypothetical protein
MIDATLIITLRAINHPKTAFFIAKIPLYVYPEKDHNDTQCFHSSMQLQLKRFALQDEC